MTGADVPAAAREAADLAEAAWYEDPANGLWPDAGVQAWAHKLAQDLFAAGVQWAAQQADGLKFRLYRPAKDGPGGGTHALDVIPAHELASLLRQEGGIDG